MTSPLGRLAELTGEPAGELERWIQLGLLAPPEAEEATACVVEQVRVFRLLRRRGFEIDVIAAAARSQPELFIRYFEQIAVRPGELQTLEEAVRAHGLDLPMVRRMWEASGLAEQGEIGTDEDIQTLKAMAEAVQAGLPEEALAQLVRVYADATARIAEAETRVFHFQVHERLRAEGHAGAELSEITATALERLQPLIDPALLYFHRKALTRAVREDLALHLAEEVELLPPGDTSGRLPLAVVFVDLAHFTSMTEAMGDLAAARVLDRFSQLARRAALSAGGRVVKQIGDEFMLVFPDAAGAVSAALEIRAAAAKEPAFLATRIGVHYGPVLAREGDYVGTTVNVAARVTAGAAAHQLLVSANVRTEAAGLGGVTFMPVDTRSLEGISEQVELFSVTPEGEHEPEARTVDPVCGMIIDPESRPVRLEVEGSERVFCSERCLQRFVADPDRYR
ncbi:MAG: YHS domain-containing protein [Actinomycetota bacterium]|nr:YHS domain-containing protein [Actinomycetota bacterium]